MNSRFGLIFFLFADIALFSSLRFRCICFVIKKKRSYLIIFIDICVGLTVPGPPFALNLTMIMMVTLIALMVISMETLISLVVE